MLKTKLASIAAAAALSFGAIGSAQAMGIIAGNFKFTLDNYDSGTTGYGTGAPVCNTVAGCDAAATSKAPGSVGSVNTSADTMGIFSVALIIQILADGSEVNVFTKGVDGYLTGIFGGLEDYKVNSGCIGTSCVTETFASGGKWAIYKNTVDYNPLLGPKVGSGKDLNALMYPGISGGPAWLSGEFVSGAIAGDTTTTYTTLYNTKAVAGNGQGYMNITGGTEELKYATKSLTDMNGVNRDLFLTTAFDDVNKKASTTCGVAGDPSTCWTVTSVSQIKGQAVPEPGTMALAGLALLGAGLASRRRKS